MTISSESAPAGLRAEEVTKRFGTVQAVDDVSIELAAGACLALVGESGSGKSTLLRMFNRIVDPDAGRILIDGEDVRATDAVELRRGIGYVPQEGGLMPHWRVLRNAALVPALRGDPNADGAAATALQLVGLDAGRFGDRWPSELSGGQRQRVAIARALAARPGILLLDEAFGALDAITRSDLHQTFLRLRTDLPVTTVLVTHDLAEAVVLASRVAVMRRGRIEQEGTVDEVFTHPETEYVAQLIDRAGVRR